MYRRESFWFGKLTYVTRESPSDAEHSGIRLIRAVLLLELDQALQLVLAWFGFPFNFALFLLDSPWIFFTY